MSLKTRVEKLETKANPQGDKDWCVFIEGVPFDGVIGYRHDNDVYMRLAGESDNELRKRVELAALSKTAQNDCGVKVALVHSISDND